MGSVVSCTGMNQLSEGKQELQQGEPMKAVQNWSVYQKVYQWDIPKEDDKYGDKEDDKRTRRTLQCRIITFNK